MQAEGRLIIEQARTRWHIRREEEAAALANLELEARRIETERAWAVICAPVKGAVLGLVGISPGVYLAPGQVVGSLSPDDRLLVETLVSARHIGLVRLGQPVRLQIDAFPFTQWGLVEARVSAIAADAHDGGEGAAPVFKVTLEPARLRLELPSGASGDLGKGMSVSARFLTARRTLLQFIHQGARDWLDPSNRIARRP